MGQMLSGQIEFSQQLNVLILDANGMRYNVRDPEFNNLSISLASLRQVSANSTGFENIYFHLIFLST